MVDRSVTEYACWLALSTELGKVRLHTAAQHAFVGALKTSVAEYGCLARLFGALGGLGLPSPTLACLPTQHTL